MSASDSDNSIDWLASDDEDNESVVELGCNVHPRPAQPQPPPAPSSPGRLGQSEESRYSHDQKDEEEDDDDDDEDDDEGGWEGSGEDSGQGTPSSRTAETWDGRAGVGLLCPAGRPERSKGRKTHPAYKRPLSPAAMTEHRERQMISSQSSEKSRLFAAKCMELQCYIHPLSLILNGLRTGRYRERLSSFQESVAMDRIQRIMGVLQNPCMGERYINIILKIEDMLKSWFPHIKPRDQHTVAQTEEPVSAKKPKLSASTTALPGAAVSPFFAASAPSSAGAKAPRVTDLTSPPPTGAYSAGNVKWLHSAPLGSPTAEQAQGGTRVQPPFPRSKALTQDSSVSSSTDGRPRTDPHTHPVRPSPAKINAPCLERLLKSTESIIGHKGAAASGCS